MRSPFGSLARAVANQVQVPLTSRYSGTGVGFFGRRRRQDDELLSTYESVGTVFAIVHSLATATSKVEWHLYRCAPSGMEEDRVEVLAHPALDRWKMPNPFMPRRRFMELAQQHVDLVGESDVLVSSAKLGPKKFLPLELWPLRPDRIQPVPDPYTFIKGYVYTGPDGDQIPLETWECLPILMPNPRDPYRGLGPVQAILTNLESTKAADEWERAFYENSAAPGGVIQVPNTLSDPQFDQLRDRWDAGHRGASKAHRVAILENGMTWQDASYSQRDQQFAELRQARRDTILEAFGFPKPMLGVTDDVNRANAEAAEYVFSKWLIEERLDRWKDWLNFQLLPLYGNTGQGLEFDYDSPVSENSDAANLAVTARSNALVAMAGAGFDATETQRWLDIPEIPFKKPEPAPNPFAPPVPAPDQNTPDPVTPDGTAPAEEANVDGETLGGD